MKKLLFLLWLPLQLAAQNHYTQYVDPFIGTGGHGHTYPGPSLPFGMVQPGPDTRLSGWDGCSGYHYSDLRIFGFSHTHLSGTGCSDYGDVMLMPTVGKLRFNHNHYSSSFKKENEKASPGYYAVFLDDPKVKVELTATLRSGLHKYTFPKTDAANVILDLTHRDKVIQSELNINGNSEITGYRISTAWSSRQVVYFVIQFSKPFKKFGIVKDNTPEEGARHNSGNQLKAWVQFDAGQDEAILVKVGISAVSIDGARKNLEAEQNGFDFEKVRKDAELAWDKELGKIDVESNREQDKRTFYTALYHTMLTPNVFQDVDGKYLGRDGQTHETKDFTYYTVFSLWDTYRALHPLLNLIDRKRTSDFVNTFITQYEQCGLLPVWELASYETFCMIGYHSVSVIADAYMKGIPGFDADKALEAMQNSSAQSKKELRAHKKPGPFVVNESFFRYSAGWDDYQKYGYIRYKLLRESVSKTLEFAYDDWCIAQMAKKMGNTPVYEKYIQRASNYKNLFDPSTGFMRARDQKFIRHFDPYQVNHNYTESNAWQYAFYVPQDLSGHMKLLGGKEKLAAFLDTLFSTSSKLTGHHQPDISGMIGQYAHGNEPSHQIAYEYDYAGQAWKTQAMVRRVMRELYSDQPDGLAGNEDCGQMSAWYIFSALGFYPVCPGSDHYAIGSPLFRKAVIHLENGKTFTLQAKDNSDKSPYIQHATLNGKEYSKSYLKYEDVANGGLLELEMGDQPNKSWGTADSDVPVTSIQ